MKKAPVLWAIALAFFVCCGASQAQHIDSSLIKKPEPFKYEKKIPDNLGSNKDNKKDVSSRSSDNDKRPPYLFERPTLEVSGFGFTSSDPYLGVKGYGGLFQLTERTDRIGSAIGFEAQGMHYSYLYNATEDFPKYYNVLGVANEFKVGGILRFLNSTPDINFEELRAGVIYKDEKKTVGFEKDEYQVTKQKSVLLTAGYTIDLYRDMYSNMRLTRLDFSARLMVRGNSETFIRGKRQEKSDLANESGFTIVGEQDLVGFGSLSMGLVGAYDFRCQDNIKIIGLGMVLRNSYKGGEPFKVYGKMDMNLNKEGKDNLSFSLVGICQFASTVKWIRNGFGRR